MTALLSWQHLEAEPTVRRWPDRAVERQTSAGWLCYGAVVNTSIGGLVCASRTFPSAAAKVGVVAPTRQMGVEFASHGIRVNAACPGTVITRLVERNWLDKREDLHQRRATAARAYPLGRLGVPEDVANTDLFLDSDKTAWITGHAPAVDSGYTMA